MKNTCIDCGKPLPNGDQACDECSRLFHEAIDKSCKEGTNFSLEEHREKIRKQSIYFKK